MRVTKRSKVFTPTYCVDHSQAWPRRIAGRIDAMETRHAKVDALSRVDDEYREWVRFYLNDWRVKRKWQRRISK